MEERNDYDDLHFSGAEEGLELRPGMLMDRHPWLGNAMSISRASLISVPNHRCRTRTTLSTTKCLCQLGAGEGSKSECDRRPVEAVTWSWSALSTCLDIIWFVYAFTLNIFSNNSSAWFLLIVSGCFGFGYILNWHFLETSFLFSCTYILLHLDIPILEASVCYSRVCFMTFFLDDLAHLSVRYFFVSLYSRDTNICSLLFLCFFSLLFLTHGRNTFWNLAIILKIMLWLNFWRIN